MIFGPEESCSLGAINFTRTQHIKLYGLLDLLEHALVHPVTHSSKPSLY